jgi:hypothetical protein
VLGLLALFGAAYPLLVVAAVVGVIPLGMITRRWVALAQDVG